MLPQPRSTETSPAIWKPPSRAIETARMGLILDSSGIIGHYLKNYHGIAVEAATKFSDITRFLAAVFEKIAGDLECYGKDLEAHLELRP
jgi:hypothetical protein